LISLDCCPAWTAPPPGSRPARKLASFSANPLYALRRLMSPSVHDPRCSRRAEQTYSFELMAQSLDTAAIVFQRQDDELAAPRILPARAGALASISRALKRVSVTFVNCERFPIRTSSASPLLSFLDAGERPLDIELRAFVTRKKAARAISSW